MKADTLRGQQSRGHRTGPGVPQGPPVASSVCEGLLRWPEHRSFLRQMRSRGRERRQRSASLPPGARKAATWGPWTGLERPSAHVDLPSVSTSEGPWGALPSELAPDLPAPPRPTSITCTAEPGGRPPTPSAGTPELLPMSPALTAQPRGLGSPRSAGFSVTPPYSSLPRRTFRFILLLKLSNACTWSKTQPVATVWTYDVPSVPSPAPGVSGEGPHTRPPCHVLQRCCTVAGGLLGTETAKRTVSRSRGQTSKTEVSAGPSCPGGAGGRGCPGLSPRMDSPLRFVGSRASPAPRAALCGCSFRRTPVTVRSGPPSPV